MRAALAFACVAVLVASCKPKIKTAPCEEIVLVTADYPGASPREVEQGVMLALEESIAQIDDIVSIRSTASEGHGQVVISVRGGRASAVREQVMESVGRVSSFPEAVERPTIFEPMYRSVTWVVVHADRAPMELHAAAVALSEDIEDLKQFSVDVVAPGPPQVEVEVARERLAALGITREQVRAALSNATVARPHEDLSQLEIGTKPDGTMAWLSDVATVRTALPATPRAWFEGKPAAVLLVQGDKLPPIARLAAAHGLEAVVGPPPRVNLCGNAKPQAGDPSGLAITAKGEGVALQFAKSLKVPDALVLHGASLSGGSAESPAGRAEVWSLTGADPSGWQVAAPPGISTRVLEPRKHEIRIELTGVDSSALERVAKFVARGLQERPDVTEARLSPDFDGKPEVTFRIPRHAAAELGVSTSVVAREVRAAIEGETFSIQGKRNKQIVPSVEPYVRVVLRFGPPLNDPARLRELVIDTPRGRVPLSSVTELSIAGGARTIHRVDQREVIAVEVLAKSAAARKKVKKFVVKTYGKTPEPGVSLRIR